MRLKKLKIFGFKSFVDSTDVYLPANLIAVVGPNGCGKSNVIDAVRWVMGEASAKMLRGDSMTDVIFNGSDSRKAVSQATVELLFDNSDHTGGGDFARFAEISVKRTLSRDGISNYYINRIKTRRKDVLDLFRGTGLGPRSYSIIEQGMVGRIIEARPDDLRLFVEEAAGTSKYKERRRETETRIAHTRENLNRVADIREQLDKQLRRLKRQASAAKRYKTLKQQQRLLNQQLLMLKLAALNEKLAEQDRASAQHTNQLEAAITTQRTGETETEKLRQRQADSQAQHSQAQQEYYQLVADITNMEQRIAHLGETKQQQRQEMQRLQADQDQQQQQLESNTAQVDERQHQQSELATQIEQQQQHYQQVEESLAAAEGDIESWQVAWDEFNEQSQALMRQKEVEQSRVAQLQQNLQRSTAQTDRSKQDQADTQQLLATVDVVALRTGVQQHDEVCAHREQEFQHTEQALQSLQQARQQNRDENAKLQARQHQLQSRLASLRQIQTATLGGDDTALQNWFKDSGLAKQPKLAEQIQVDDGWQVAVDRAMNSFLGAVCVTQLSPEVLSKRPDCAFTLVVDKPASSAQAAVAKSENGIRLLDKVAAGATDLTAFLGGVYVAESLSAALARQSTLSDRECVVTRDGILLGANWISFASQSQLETGMLARDKEINQLQGNLSQTETQAEALAQKFAQIETEHQADLQKSQQQRTDLQQLRRDNTEMHSDLGREEARYLEAEQRCDALTKEIDRLKAQVKNDESEISKAQTQQHTATTQYDTLSAQRDALLKQKTQQQSSVAQQKEELHKASEQIHQNELHKQRLEVEFDSITNEITRLEEQLQKICQRRAQINDGLATANDPATEQAELQSMLERQLAMEKRVSEFAAAAAELDSGMQNLAIQHSVQSKVVSSAQDILHQHSLAKQETIVRRDTLAEQLNSLEHEQQSPKVEIPQNANIAEWELKYEQMQNTVARLDTVNLVAIEEFEEESARKEYLDKQYADLSEALDTLRTAIGKIDRKTRSKFKETFEQLNAGFQAFFPQLFGGGKVELQLTSDDYLTAGIIVMARPPGKRNSHIHLLSGGEKALTAVAFLFALFKLNPAPFCMLDEVDAPLDDANVKRYCETLKSLMEISQMIVITHNKITMEAADTLVGVTMSEPGVSRLVSVDIKQAMSWAQ